MKIDNQGFTTFVLSIIITFILYVNHNSFGIVVNDKLRYYTVPILEKSIEEYINYIEFNIKHSEIYYNRQIFISLILFFVFFMNSLICKSWGRTFLLSSIPIGISIPHFLVFFKVVSS